MTAADEWEGPAGEDSPEGPDFRPVRRPRPKKRWGLRLFALLVVLIGGGTAAWYLWGDALLLDADAEIPLVRAETGPVKVRPESPGGMEVPDRDKLVYDRMEGNGERPQVERLLPPPPVPQLPPPAESADRPPAEPAPPSPAQMPGAPPPETAEAQATPVPTPEVPSPEEVEAVKPPPPPPPPPDPKKQTVEAKSIRHYVPVFSINSDFWWRHRT